MRKSPKPDDAARAQALDRRALELLLSGTGYTLESAYQQATEEREKALELRPERA